MDGVSHTVEVIAATSDGTAGLPASGGKRLRVQGVGDIKIKLHRPVSGKIKTVSVNRAGNPQVRVLLMPSLGTAVA